MEPPVVDPHPPAPLEPPRRLGVVPAALLGAAVVLLFIVVQGVGFVLADLAGLDGDGSGRLTARDALGYTLINAVGIAAVAAFTMAGWGSRRTLGLDPPPGATARGAWALLPVGLLVIGPSFGVALAEGEPLVARHVDAVALLAYLALALAIAVNEELWFRGLLTERLGRAGRPTFTVVASAVLFGLPHYNGTSASLLNAGSVMLAVGVPFAAVRLRCGALAPLVAWHAVIDARAFLHEASITPRGNPTAAEVAAAMVLPALVALGYLAWFARRPGAATER